jgi:hypothetical protein
VPLFALAGRDEPANTFEMARPYHAGAAEPVLFVSLHPQSRSVLSQFRSVASLGSETIPGGTAEGRSALRMLRSRGRRDRPRPAAPLMDVLPRSYTTSRATPQRAIGKAARDRAAMSHQSAL